MSCRSCALLAIASLIPFASAAVAADSTSNAENPLTMPSVGSHRLGVLSPTILELELITTKDPDPAFPKQWNFVGANFESKLPSPETFDVLVDRKKTTVEKVGFKRRVLYAPLKRRDLRIANDLYLQLADPIRDGQTVEVLNRKGDLWPSSTQFRARADALRFSPAIHVNQVGYVPAFSKKAMIGYYLGSLGEMTIPSGSEKSVFTLVDVSTGQTVFQGQLKPRLDAGFTFPTYQKVFEADFANFKKPGEYRLAVPGLGASFPFLIDEGVTAAFARAYALGLYHQRCGTSNDLPFTRFVHAPCHTAQAEVPTMQFKGTQSLINKMSSEGGKEPRHTAPQLKNVNASLYPFVKQGRVDVSGGHHDAGDYSKYTINSAGLVHHLVFAADVFEGAGELDNLGIPESGDGKSDLLQEAKWEADFLAKMQDSDGGFYFLVYPKERPYEDDVLPDHGDPQVVWPKTTATTAAAVAALAQASSSPLFKKQFPEAARVYLDKARKGWDFLERAIAQHGRDGAYQKVSHYGNEFMHDDELAWAATELFLATGDPVYERELLAHFEPTSRDTKRWTWWRMYEGYGCAIRSYAFAAKTGRLKPEQLNPVFLAKCRSEIIAAAQDQSRFARECAYGSSFPDPTKRFRSAGWYFSNDQAFDIAVASSLDAQGSTDQRSGFLEAMLTNLNFEGGCNPVNATYLTGLGWRRQRDIVHQYAQNDRRVLPPSGLPIGNIQAGFQFLHHYGKELGALSFPPDGAEDRPYPFYDRWGDSFNVSTEFVIVDQARGLATTAFLMAKTALRKQPWKSGRAQIVGMPAALHIGQHVTVKIQTTELDLSRARIVWETKDQEPAFGEQFDFTAAKAGATWIEAEAQLPDGRRIFAVKELTVLGQ